MSQERDPSTPENETQLGLENETPRSTGGGDEEDGEEPISSQALVSPAPVDNSGAEQMTTEQANHELIQRHGRRVHTVLAEHAATHPDCDDPVRHLLASPAPTLRVIEGGKTA